MLYWFDWISVNGQVFTKMKNNRYMVVTIHCSFF